MHAHTESPSNQCKQNNFHQKPTTMTTNVLYVPTSEQSSELIHESNQLFAIITDSLITSFSLSVIYWKSGNPYNFSLKYIISHCSQQEMVTVPH